MPWDCLFIYKKTIAFTHSHRQEVSKEGCSFPSGHLQCVPSATDLKGASFNSIDGKQGRQCEGLRKCIGRIHLGSKKVNAQMPNSPMKHFLNEHKGLVILMFIKTSGYFCFTSYRFSRTVHCFVCFIIVSNFVIGSTVCRWLSRECNVTAKPYLAHFSSGDPHLHPA